MKRNAFRNLIPRSLSLKKYPFPLTVALNQKASAKRTWTGFLHVSLNTVFPKTNWQFNSQTVTRKLPAEVYKRLHIIPENFIVDEHHVHVYASKNNKGTIARAKRPADLFRNSIATASLVASMINGKYVNALPLERQSKAYKTNGIILSTNTMANWVIKSCDYYLSLIYDRLNEQIYDSKVIHADESPVKTMRIDNIKIKNGKKKLYVGIS